jgi:hypothetical protein
MSASFLTADFLMATLRPHGQQRRYFPLVPHAIRASWCALRYWPQLKHLIERHRAMVIHTCHQTGVIPALAGMNDVPLRCLPSLEPRHRQHRSSVLALRPPCWLRWSGMSHGPPCKPDQSIFSVTGVVPQSLSSPSSPLDTPSLLRNNYILSSKNSQPSCAHSGQTFSLRDDCTSCIMRPGEGTR